MNNPLQILGGVAGAVAGYLATLLLLQRDRTDRAAPDHDGAPNWMRD
jgi:hypothetical protein